MSAPTHATYEFLIQQPIESLLEITSKHSRTDEQIDERRATWSENTRIVGKAMAALKVKFAELCNSGKLAPGTTFKDWHKKQTATAKHPGYEPQKDAETAAMFYATMVIGGKITEENYDNSKTDWILTANAAISTANGNMESQVVKNVAEMFTKVKDGCSPTDMAKKLRQIKNEAKGKVSGVEGESKKPIEINAQIVSSVVRAACLKGYHGVIIAEMGAEAANAKSLDPKKAKEFFQSTVIMLSAWNNCGIDKTTLEEWKKEVLSSNAKPINSQPTAK